MNISAAPFRVLAVVVAIRTMLSWAMVLEMSGRRPWLKAPATESRTPHKGGR